MAGRERTGARRQANRLAGAASLKRIFALGVATTLYFGLIVAVASAAPPNDNFANAEVLSGNSDQATGSNIDATGEPGEPNHSGYPGNRRSVWYSWQAPASGAVAVDTCGSNFDTFLAAYTGTAVNALSVVASDDDSAEFCPGLTSGVESQIAFNATAGTTYWIAVDGVQGDQGGIILSLWMTGLGGGTPPAVPSDSDGDGVPNPFDNCLFESNPGQEDADGDGIGDACDPAYDPAPPQQELQPEPQPKADGTLTIEANEGKVEKGRKVFLSGQLNVPSNENCEQFRAIEIQRRLKSEDDSKFVTFATDTTHNLGGFKLRTKVTTTYFYRAVVAETDTCDAETSNSKKVRAKKKKKAAQ
jgi:hypothetical protein